MTNSHLYNESDSDKQEFVPIEGQSFRSQREWITWASALLTDHPNYFNSEHGEQKGWCGNHFTALCYDQKGRRCKKGGDFQRAEDDDSYPIYWVWPDQIHELLIARQSLPKGGNSDV